MYFFFECCIETVRRPVVAIGILELIVNTLRNLSSIAVRNTKEIYAGNENLCILCFSNFNTTLQEPRFANTTFFLWISSSIVEVENMRSVGIVQPFSVESNLVISPNEWIFREIVGRICGHTCYSSVAT